MDDSLPIVDPPENSSPSFDTAVTEVPVTVERKPFLPSHSDTEQNLENPGTARANIAASAQYPAGTQAEEWASRHQHQTVLQQHCEFFDSDHDGVIWPPDTFRGFRAIGFNIFLSFFSMLVIHAAFSYPTLPSGRILPDPAFRIFLQNIHRTKHGSDSGSYDNEGRFLPQKFEDFFTKYGHTYAGKALTKKELRNGIAGQRLFADPFGWLAVILEWLATYIFLWPVDGVIWKKDVRRIFDGSIFYEAAEKRSNSKKIR
jgi:hypothetical protein